VRASVGRFVLTIMVILPIFYKSESNLSLDISQSRRILDKRPGPIVSPNWTGTTVHRLSVHMMQKMMTAFHPYYFKSSTMKCGNERFTCNVYFAHYSIHTRWTPTNSGGVLSSCFTSKQSSIASRIRAMSSSNDFACMWQPGSSGTDQTKYPSVSRSITTLKALDIFSSYKKHRNLIKISKRK
jgi:hypothetical protein